jgi:hypothetical protein
MTTKKSPITNEEEVNRRLEKPFDVISEALGCDIEGTLRDGLPYGEEAQWGYDPELVEDLALAVTKWNERVKKKG